MLFSRRTLLALLFLIAVAVGFGVARYIVPRYIPEIGKFYAACVQGDPNEDPDNDGICTSDGDNCPDDYNLNQHDNDGDGAGNRCDETPNGDAAGPDDDLDGIGNDSDNCPSVFNPAQADCDGNGTGNLCEPGYEDQAVCPDATGGGNCKDNVSVVISGGSATFTNVSDGSCHVNLVSWKVNDQYGADFLGTQEQFDTAEGDVPPHGTLPLSVDVPNCFHQVDAALGAIPNANNAGYGTNYIDGAIVPAEFLCDGTCIADSCLQTPTPSTPPPTTPPPTSPPPTSPPPTSPPPTSPPPTSPPPTSPPPTSPPPSSPPPTSPPVSVGPFSCGPASQTISVGQTANFQSVGGLAPYTWTAPGSATLSPNGSSASARYTQAGQYTVQVRDAQGSTATCVVVAQIAATTPPPGSPLLAIQKTVRVWPSGVEQELANATPNATVEFVIRVSSIGSITAMQVIARDTLPAGLTYQGGTTTVDGAPVADGIVGSGIALGDMAPGRTVTIRFRATLAPAPFFGIGATVLTNIAYARASNTGEVNDPAQVRVGTITEVPTGPTESAVLALIVSSIVTLLYVGYASTERFRFREATSAAKQTRKDEAPDFKG